MSRLDKKRKGIVKQITYPVFIISVIIIVIAVITFVLFNMTVLLNQRFEYTTQIAGEVVTTIEDYKSLDFLVPYWHDHYDEMEFFYGNREILIDKESELAELIPDYSDEEHVTVEQVLALDEDGQRLFAEVCYYQLCEDFDRIKRSYGPLFLYSFSIDGDNQFFYITGTKEDELRESSGGEIFELGCTYPYQAGRYPTLDSLIATGEPADRIELSLNKDADRTAVHVFAPVTCNGQMVMIVGVSTDWADLIDYTLGLTEFLAGFIIVLVASLTLMFFRLLRKYAVSPLFKERDIIKTYEQDKNSAKAVPELKKIDSDNEIEELADAFSSMLVEIERYMEETQKTAVEKERLGAELSMAASIQESQLPSKFPAFPDRKDFDIYASMDPAKEVGGDFYDFFLVDEDHIAMVMADVSGKGIPASLFMMISKLLLQSRIMMGESPAEALSNTNSQLMQNNEVHQFVTVWLAVFDLKTGKGIAANAGHEHPVIRRAGGKYELVEYKHSPPVATMRKLKFRDHEFELNPGDSLFVYTDGVPEATNSDNELFGTERMLEALNKDSYASCEAVLKNVSEGIDEFVAGAEQFDDITMLCFKYFGNK
ncbi:MAG: PP2C family protein-serine/threonine phosphatase [Clostridiales bacterium]|nr:PP2C family protein-serine/threonine phosphatase [Clostridiales bacterium]